MGFEWAAFEEAMVDAMVRAVQTAVAGRHDQHFYAVAWDQIYRETDGVITLPVLGMNSQEARQAWTDGDRAHLSRNVADWEEPNLDWLSEAEARDWEQRLSGFASRGSTKLWEQTFQRYLRSLVRACRTSRRRLRDAGVVDPEFLVLVFDDEYGEPLLRRTLPARELHRHFPEFDRHRAELARVAALPLDEQARYYSALLGVFGGLISGEEAAQHLIRLGQPAINELLPRLSRTGQAWEAAKLLADLGSRDEGVISALTAALDTLEGADQLWTARALARLGQLDVILERADRLPAEAVVTALAANYTSFRDHGLHPVPLDYRPLEAVLSQHPGLEPALAEELKPGSSPCAITAAEVDEALRGLQSAHAVVRRHAVDVLGERRLGRAARVRIVPALQKARAHDPDPTVCRLAALSLKWWGQP